MYILIQKPRQHPSVCNKTHIDYTCLFRKDKGAILLARYQRLRYDIFLMLLILRVIYGMQASL